MSEVHPNAIWSGSFRVFDVEVKCHTLADGRRIIEAESFHKLMEAVRAPGDMRDDPDVVAFTRWQQGYHE